MTFLIEGRSLVLDNMHFDINNIEDMYMNYDGETLTAINNKRCVVYVGHKALVITVRILHHLLEGNYVS